VLARILAAVDVELRTAIAPYDDHDDVLDAAEASQTPTELAERRATQDRFSQALRRGVRHSLRQSKFEEND
jgi:hypothetical protein